jgi:hypothetical protein
MQIYVSNLYISPKINLLINIMKYVNNTHLKALTLRGAYLIFFKTVEVVADISDQAYMDQMFDSRLVILLGAMP